MKFTLFASVLLCMASAVWAGNTPPTITPMRQWDVIDSATVGQKVRQVTASDSDEDDLVFSLSPPSLPPGWRIGGREVGDGTRFFRIDTRTGGVYVKESLLGQAEKLFMVDVGVYDGHVLAKMGVLVAVHAAETSDGASSQQTASGGGLVLPPELPDRRPTFAALPPRPLAAVTFPEEAEIDFSDRFKTPQVEPIATAARPSITPPPPEPLSTALASSPEAGGAETTEVAGADPAAEPRESSSDKMTVVVPVAVVVAVGVLAAVGLLLMRRKKTKKRLSIDGDKIHKMETFKTISNSSTASTAAADDADTSLSMQHWTSKKAISNRYESWHIGEIDHEWRNQNKTDDGWEFPRHHLRVISILGEGCFGQVWKCEALNIADNEGTSSVAVKTLKETAGDKERQELLKELQVMKTLKPHPNIVTLLGCCTDKDPVFVIMEYVSGGKLQSFLRKSRADHYYGNLHGSSSHLSSRDLTSFAFQVARAMDYLTSKDIIHRDLAARNVLITDDRVCKVADFGFARDVMGTHIYERKSEGRLPIRWMAPESLYDNIFSAKTDVWSFGILLWEIVTLGSTPYPGMAANEVMRQVREGYRLEKPEHCKREVYNIMFYCWEKDQEQRPAFGELVQLLEQLLMSETDYIELERFPDHSYYNMVPPMDEKI